jgi:type IV pilus assembly protein PilP
MTRFLNKLDAGLIPALLMALVVSVLTACSGSEQVEVKDWMKQQKAKTPANVAPIAPPVVFSPVPYTQGGTSDPFDDSKLKAALAKARAASGASALQPDLARKREALEAFPIDNIRMIGYVVKQGKPTALLSSASTLYNTVVGNYVGQDFGKVMAISEQEITIKELVQDGAGVWTERTTKLPLILAGKEIKK